MRAFIKNLILPRLLKIKFNTFHWKCKVRQNKMNSECTWQWVFMLHNHSKYVFRWKQSKFKRWTVVKILAVSLFDTKVPTTCMSKSSFHPHFSTNVDIFFFLKRPRTVWINACCCCCCTGWFIRNNPLRYAISFSRGCLHIQLTK